ncbi:Mu-like prophage FluMu protein gp28 [Leminorella richardii]|uniref:Mu-like prophage FluMu protein gp28 n=1 Tax=Leminorella richardii TaxID=158841 RepID=A0A2X4XE89_9GAMM|nr:terminase family protein [Leminorella richardii]SQI34954.1 Mu-like prophage FluMu protein gp28 [Leminorella richardii]
MSTLNAQLLSTTSASVNAVLGNTFQKNDLLLGYQKRWIADASVLKVAEKSRRTGLTWAEAADAALNASLARDASGCNTFYVGSNKDMAREFIDAVAMWAKAYDRAASEVVEEALETVIDNERQDILTFVVYFSSGFKVQALSSNPKNLRGMQGNVVIDEAAFHEQLGELMKAAMALTMWGAKIRIISTHNGNENLFNTLIQDIRAGRRKGTVHTITLDDACAEGLYQRICQVTRQAWSPAAEVEWKADLLGGTETEDDALEEYYCVPKHGSGAYIPRVLLDRATSLDCTVVRWKMPKGYMDWTEEERFNTALTFCREKLLPLLDNLEQDTRHAYGQDFARSADLSVIAIGSIEQNTCRRIPVTVELHDVPYNQQREIAFFIIDRLPRLVGVAVDKTGNGGYLGEALLLRYGDQMVDAIHITDLFYREWSPKYKALYEAGYIDIPRDEDIIADQRQIQNIRGIPKIDKSRRKGGDGKQRHGDSAGAYLMFTRASYMEGFETEGYIPLPPKSAPLSAAADEYDDDEFDTMRGCW